MGGLESTQILGVLKFSLTFPMQETNKKRGITWITTPVAVISLILPTQSELDSPEVGERPSRSMVWSVRTRMRPMSHYQKLRNQTNRCLAETQDHLALDQNIALYPPPPPLAEAPPRALKMTVSRGSGDCPRPVNPRGARYKTFTKP